MVGKTADDQNVFLLHVDGCKYLGSEMEVLRGRTLLDDGICSRLPIIFERSMILFPEQTLPLVARHTPMVSMLRSCIAGNGTFGVVRVRLEKDPLYGTTAEIQEYSDNGLQGVRIKARGQQRFKVLRLMEVNRQKRTMLESNKIMFFFEPCPRASPRSTPSWC